MTQAKLDLQTVDLHTKLEQTLSALTTQPLFNDSPILFLESLDQVHSQASEQVEQTEHNTTHSKDQTPPNISHETPPPLSPPPTNLNKNLLLLNIHHPSTILPKFYSVLQNRTIPDFTQLLDPNKRNPSDSLITTLTHLIHCYDRTHKLNSYNHSI